MVREKKFRPNNTMSKSGQVSKTSPRASRFKLDSFLLFATCGVPISILMLAIVLKLNIDAENKWWSIAFDCGIILLSLALSHRSIKLSACLIGLTFSGFCTWHFFNLGNTCQCFGNQVVSDYDSMTGPRSQPRHDVQARKSR